MFIWLFRSPVVTKPHRIFSRKKFSTKLRLNTHSHITLITEMGFTLALALVINYLGSGLFLALFPQGGGISFYPVPLILFVWRWGWKWSLLLDWIYGVMTILLPGSTILSFYQVFTDFFLQYLPLTLAALVRRWIIDPKANNGKIYAALFIGPTIALFGMFVIAFWSGVFFYSQYAGPGEGPYYYSFIYNIFSTVGTLAFTVLVFWVAKNQFVKLVTLHYNKYY